MYVLIRFDRLKSKLFMVCAWSYLVASNLRPLNAMLFQMVHSVYLSFFFSKKNNIVYLLIYIVEIKVPTTTTRVHDRKVI